MLKEALSYIIGLSKPETMLIHGEPYTDKPLSRVVIPTVKPLQLSTLSSLVDYVVNSQKDSVPAEDIIIAIRDYNHVEVISRLICATPERNFYIDCVSKTPIFTFGRWYNSEDFNIAMQALFCPTDTQKAVLRIVGNITDEAVKNVSDNGITQQVTVKKGKAMVDNEFLPNPVSLAPYRTFVEVPQPTSNFVLRMREGHEGNEIALFDADGGTWKIQAIQNIKQYIVDEIKRQNEEVYSKITILA